MRIYRYRVNFGNGQASNTMSKRGAFRHLATQANDPYVRFFYVEWKDPGTGEWFRTGTPRAPIDCGTTGCFHETRESAENCITRKWPPR